MACHGMLPIRSLDPDRHPDLAVFPTLWPGLTCRLIRTQTRIAILIPASIAACLCSDMY